MELMLIIVCVIALVWGGVAYIRAKVSSSNQQRRSYVAINEIEESAAPSLTSHSIDGGTIDLTDRIHRAIENYEPDPNFDRTVWEARSKDLDVRSVQREIERKEMFIGTFLMTITEIQTTINFRHLDSLFKQYRKLLACESAQ